MQPHNSASRTLQAIIACIYFCISYNHGLRLLLHLLAVPEEM